MQGTAAVEVVLIGGFLTGLVFAWDGLVRRHVRLVRDFLPIHLECTGRAAVLVGTGGALLALLMLALGISQLQRMVAACRGAVLCVVQHVVGPPFTTWQTAGALIIAIGAFALWARTAGDRSGPYRRTWMAPGVVDDERVLLARIAHDLQAAALAPVPRRTAEMVVRQVRRSMVMSAQLRNLLTKPSGEQDVNPVAETLVRGLHPHALRVSEAQALVIVVAIVVYYRDLYARAARAYPWQRRRRRSKRGTSGTR